MTQNTATGLRENVAALLCYVGGWISGIVFLILEPHNKTLKFHAMQSIIVFGACSVVDMVFGWIPFISLFFVPVIGVITFILWIILMVQAYNGKMLKLWIAGEIAEKWANTTSGPANPPTNPQ